MMLNLLNDYVDKARKVINTSPEAQKFMDILAVKAKEKNLSEEEWKKNGRR